MVLPKIFCHCKRSAGSTTTGHGHDVAAKKSEERKTTHVHNKLLGNMRSIGTMRGQIARISRNHVRRRFSQKIDPLRDCKWMSDNIALWFKELWRTILSESPMLAKSEMFHFLKNSVNTFAHIGYFAWRYDITLSQRISLSM